MKYSNRFTAYGSYPIELKLGRMLPDYHSRSELDFSISFQKGAVRARLLKYLSRFIAYNIHPIELKLGRIILNISPHNLARLLHFLQVVTV